MTKRRAERRRSERQRAGLPNGIEIQVQEAAGAPRVIMAKLIDASPGGVGVETLADLPVGIKVCVRANLRSRELGLRVSGDARVAHSREAAPGRFIVGLALEELSYARAS